MIYNQIESFFDSPEGMEKLLVEFTPAFQKIEEYSRLLKNGILDNGMECTKALSELTGIYLELKPVAVIAETIKSTEELRVYTRRKEEIEMTDAKFTSAAVEREASLAVASYRRIRNIFEAYLEASERGIQSVQSVLKFLTTKITSKIDE